jgi:hypothetical protein
MRSEAAPCGVFDGRYNEVKLHIIQTYLIFVKKIDT